MELYVRHKETGEKYRVILINLLDRKVLVNERADCTNLAEGKTIFFDLQDVELLGNGETSDGYHTFNELYEHRMHLFAALCHTYLDRAWKSKLHDDGTMYDDYFIVGITTPAGDFTYHYHQRYWEMFQVKERKSAPIWDGHTSNDVIRIHSLRTEHKAHEE